jgi:aspartate racemase
VNLEINRAMGRQASAEILLRSVNFQAIVDAQSRDDWQAAGKILAAAARDLERGGARAFLIASNTMHLVYDHVAREVSIPGINIFDATCAALREKQVDRALLLGTRYTMGMPFYRDEYARRGIEVVVPGEADAKRVNEIIFRELIHGRVNEGSATYLRGIVSGAAANGTKAVILGCTELDLLLEDRDKIPGCEIIDSTLCHARAAAKWMLSPEPA